MKTKFKWGYKSDLFFIALIILIVWSLHATNQLPILDESKEVIGWINGEEVLVEEVGSYLLKNEGVQQAMEAYSTKKIQWMLMEEQGILEDSGYLHLLALLEEENMRRSVAVKKGEVIFGPEQYPKDVFLQHLFNKGVERLKTDLSATQLKVTDQEVKDYYSNHLEEYRQEDQITLEVIRIPYIQEGATNQGMKEKAYHLITKIEKGLQSQSFEEVLASSKSESEILILGGRDHGVDRRRYPQLYPFAYGLKEGEVSPIIQDQGAYFIVRLMKRQKGRLIPLEEEALHIEKVLLNQHYLQLIETHVAKASIELNHVVSDKY